MELKNAAQKTYVFFRNYRFIILIFLIGIIFMTFPKSQKEIIPQAEASASMDETIPLEEKLERILFLVEGCGSVSVLLTEAAGEQIHYQVNESGSGDTIGGSLRKETVIISDASRAQKGMICRTDPPRYLGAIVICQGAEDAKVRLSIAQAVSYATGLGFDKIAILKMK